MYKEALKHVFAAALFVLVIFPWAIGVVDMVSFILVGHTLTSVFVGDPVRSTLALVWPIFCITVGAMVWG